MTLLWHPMLSSSTCNPHKICTAVEFHSGAFCNPFSEIFRLENAKNRFLVHIYPKNPLFLPQKSLDKV